MSILSDQEEVIAKPLMNLEDIHFECTKCGKCCESNFPLTFDEMFKYKDTFIQELRISLHLFPAYLSNTEYADIKNLYQKIYLHYMTAKSKYTPFFLNPQVIQSSYEAMCPKLKNNLCSIQDSKPLNCKSLPLEATLPESMQSKQFVHWIVAGGLKRYECNLTNINVLSEEKKANKVQAPAFIVWNKETQQYDFPQTDYYSAYQQEVTDLKNSISLKQEVIQHHMLYAKTDIDSLYESLMIAQSRQGSANLVTHTGSVISAMLKLDKISKEYAKEYFSSQLILLKQEISKAKQRQNKSERDKTKHYLMIVEIYSLYLKHLSESQ